MGEESKTNIKVETVDEDDFTDDFIEYEDDEEEPQTTPEVEETGDARGHAINQNPTYDSLINTEIQL